MSSTMTIVVAIVVVLAVIALVALVATGMRDRKSQRLRQRFGPEYDRMVEETGDRHEAERRLEERLHRHQELSLRDLDPAARQGYAEAWRAVQTRFVDDPAGAVKEADELVTRLMRDRGYPSESFEQRVADVSVDHAGAAAGYRQARERLDGARDQAATDDLRQAMVSYRGLFEELLGETDAMGAARQRDERPAGVRREVT